MLIEFTVKNYRSIKDAQTLSMVKAKGDELEECNSFAPHAPGCTPLLRSAAIYGPNAAGKSNVLKAIETMETIVRKSASSGYQLKAVKCGASRRTLPLNFFAFRGKPI